MSTSPLANVLHARSRVVNCLFPREGKVARQGALLARERALTLCFRPSTPFFLLHKVRVRGRKSRARTREESESERAPLTRTASPSHPRRRPRRRQSRPETMEAEKIERIEGRGCDIYRVDEKSCFLCGQEEDLELCQHCRTVWYCSPAHRDVHRPPGARRCFPFVIRRSHLKGRLVSLARAINLEGGNRPARKKERGEKGH